MAWSEDRSAAGATASRVPLFFLAILAGCAMALAGCTRDGQQTLAVAQPRGASVAFDSIDGLPPAQFHTLVRNLNEEAQSRRLAVISRESAAAYRVRGYLAAKVVKGRTTISWVWDVFDRDEHRALRIAGEETANDTGTVRHRDAWTAADDAMLHRIAGASMERLAAFLTSPDVAPNGPAANDDAQLAFLGGNDSSPEAAGIFRIFRANADPAPSGAEDAAQAGEQIASPVPLPRRRPGVAATSAAGDTVMLAASSK